MVTKQYENSVKNVDMAVNVTSSVYLLCQLLIPSLFLFVCLSVSLSVYLCVCISLCLYISLLLSRTYHTIYLSISLWPNFLLPSSPLNYYLFISSAPTRLHLHQ